MIIVNNNDNNDCNNKDEEEDVGEGNFDDKDRCYNGN